jgi:hypothetical protein
VPACAKAWFKVIPLAAKVASNEFNLAGWVHFWRAEDEVHFVEEPDLFLDKLASFACLLQQ